MKNKKIASKAIYDSFKFNREYLTIFTAETGFKIVSGILHALTEHLKNEQKDLDNKDRFLDTIHKIAESAQEEFEELISVDSDKKTFFRNLGKLFTVLLNTRLNAAKKPKRL